MTALSRADIKLIFAQHQVDEVAKVLKPKRGQTLAEAATELRDALLNTELDLEVCRCKLNGTWPGDEE